MTSTDSQPEQKQEKSRIKKLWAKVRTSLLGESSSPQSTRTLSTQVKPEETWQKEATVTLPITPHPMPSAIPEEPTTMVNPGALQDPLPKEPQSEVGSPSVIPVLDAIEVDQHEDAIDTYQLPLPSSRSSDLSPQRNIHHAQAVYEKYGIPLNLTDWRKTEKSGVERVEKKTRMRVRYTCHSCQNVFGRDKICSRCSHDRSKCVECVRYPAKRTTERIKKERVVVVPPSPEPITLGACHECRTNFSIGEKACENCEHKICEKCLQEAILNPVETSPIQAQSTLATA